MRIVALSEVSDVNRQRRIAAALGLYIRKGEWTGLREDPGIKETEREVHSLPGYYF
ncbi:hypothetical protein D4M24_19180 [Escherichia coli]|nr:hypothetical protein D4M24_19180 [Escherichia coli]